MPRRSSKLTDEKVRVIRNLYRYPKVTKAILADVFGVSERTIHDILTGATWAHVE